MERIKLEAQHVKARAPADDAWFYENAKSIDVYISTPGNTALKCRIPRALLADWIKRTSARTE